MTTPGSADPGTTTTTVPMHAELSLVRLLRPTGAIPAGATGTVVGIYNPGRVDPGYEVEFFDAHGDTLAVLTLSATDIEPA